ncbi:ZZ-type zinc finger-containing protein P35G2,11c [Schizosaccharomyces pombe 972h-] [Rhizoctonia solani]|uniref:ZZ-type zinc finger-containing protein P35G2,11c [Schizosaccharomyces pombe 972h-] n=1 Tax=Rhizoctonia solani TaxID=456999 RepID=A0A0K6GHJ1_9AGAM|nr:ZZ-type zinc finger-containing protein P35G2,11c [Schizosaccharomyces pombe 972h-] [Rhizoctonia solani]
MAAAYSDYGSVSSMRGDIPLVVKCTFDRSMRRITFQSAQTCTYELLRARIEECFSLAASSFTISYTDDDAEVTDINGDNDLTEAVAYFQAGEEIGSTGGSVYSYRSSGPKKITLRVTVTVDYDGPSLSDTASLASMEEYAGARARAQTELRGNTNGFGLPPEEDAITLNSHSAPATAAAAPHGVPDDFSLSGTDDGDGAVVETTDVFQRLRLDTSSASLPSERGVQWLREQNAYTMRTVLGVEPEPSVSEVTDAEPDPPRSAVDSRGGDLALEMDERGNYYYTYTSESASVAEPEPQPHPSGASQLNLNWLASQQQPLPQAQPKAQSTKSSSSSSQSTPYSLESRASSSNTDVTPPPLPPRRVNPADYPGIPPEVLQFISAEAPGLETPDRVTDCSACGVVLDSFRYVCSTCGEKPSRPTQPESPNTVIDGGGKGKERAVDPFADEYAGMHTYPPGGSSRNAGYGWTYSEDYSRANPNVIRARNSQSPHTRTSPHARSTSSPHLHHPSSPAASSPGSSSGSGFENGYELCMGCIETAGVIHAAESASLSSLSSGSSATLLAGMNRDGIPPIGKKRRTGRRHAYMEKVWNSGAWTDVEQDTAISCSHCKKTVDVKPYKCVSCQNFALCFECYTQVHDIHPIHAFLVVPVTKPSERQPYHPVPRFSVDSQDQTMQHQGVLCSHCLQIIIGARFHCAVCPSVDICANCESAGLAPPEGEHESSHIMIKIPYPLDKREVNDASRRALDLWDSRDGPALGVQRPRANSVGSNQARTVLGTANKDVAIDHHILCKGCGVSIRGVRYQCATCPSLPTSYNLCFQCEQKSHLIHDPYHVFLKLPRPVDRPIESPHPVIPVVYSEPAGGHYRGPEPRAYLQGLRHSNALCDLCSSTIVGEWFRCIMCGKDYCDECESIGGHDPTHIFVVFKSKVDTQLIGAITDLTLSKPPPIWPHEVYLS